MSIPDQERDPRIGSVYERLLGVLNDADLGDTELLTVFDMLDDHMAEVRKYIVESRKADDCWDGGAP